MLLGCFLSTPTSSETLNRVTPIYSFVEKDTVFSRNEESVNPFNNIDPKAPLSYEEGISWDSLKNTIKKTEGLVLTPYHCAAGYSTIGYGHLNTEKFKFITKTQAEVLLHKDLSYGVAYLQEHTTLKGNRLKALSKFVYAFGTSKFQRSRLFKLIKKENFGPEFDKEYLKWCKIKGKKNPYLLKARIFELRLFHSQESLNISHDLPRPGMELRTKDTISRSETRQ